MAVGQVVDLSTLLREAPRNCWLALSEDETNVVGRGESVAEALEEARKAGFEDPIILWSPKVWIPTVMAKGREE